MKVNLQISNRRRDSKRKPSKEHYIIPGHVTKTDTIFFHGFKGFDHETVILKLFQFSNFLYS